MLNVLAWLKMSICCHGNQKGKIKKNLLVKNNWPYLKIIWLTWSLGESIPGLFKYFDPQKKYMAARGRSLFFLFIYRKTLNISFCRKLLAGFENNYQSC